MLRRNFISAASALLGAAFVKNAPAAVSDATDTSKLQRMLTEQISQPMGLNGLQHDFEQEHLQRAAKVPTLGQQTQKQRLSQLWTEDYVLAVCPWLAKYQVGFQVQHTRHEMAYCVAHFKLGENDLFRAMFFHGETLKPAGAFYHQQRDMFVTFTEVKQLVVEHQQTTVRENVRA